MAENEDADRFPEIHHPHDRFFRKWFEAPETASEFLQATVPESLRQWMTPERLSPENVSFLDNDLKHRESDLLWKCRTDDAEAFVYVLWEHQTQQDPWMTFRLLNYMTRIWDRWLGSFDTPPDPRSSPLPIIVPIVLYQNKRTWTAATSLGQVAKVPDDMRRFFPDFSLSLKTLEVEDCLPPGLARLGVQIMKLYWHSGDEFIALMREVLLLLQGLPEQSSYLATIYILALSPREIQGKVVEEFKKQIHLSKTTMSILESYWEEGLETGQAKGQQLMVRNMAENGLSAEEIARIAGLELDLVCRYLQESGD